MGSKFKSFQRSAHGVFVRSLQGVRNRLGNPVIGFSNIITFTDSADDINAVSRVKGNEVFKTGDNVLTGEIFDLIEYKKDFYAVGKGLTPTTLNGVARYSELSKNWGVLSSPDLRNASTSGFGTAMTIWTNLLVIVGEFGQAGSLGFSLSFGGVAWDGQQYSTIGLSFSDNPFKVGSVDAKPQICVFYADFLIGAGAFRKIQKYSGGGVGTWTELFSGAETGTGGWEVLFVYEGSLIASIQSPVATDALIRSWTNGGPSSWTLIGTATGGGDPVVLGMTEYKGDLIVGGRFDDIDGVSAEGVARWDGTTWENMGTGLKTVASSFQVNDLHVSNGFLYAVGNFRENGDGDFVTGVALWNGSKWVWGSKNAKLATAQDIETITTFSGNLDL